MISLKKFQFFEMIHLFSGKDQTRQIEEFEFLHFFGYLRGELASSYNLQYE